MFRAALPLKHGCNRRWSHGGRTALWVHAFLGWRENAIDTQIIEKSDILLQRPWITFVIFVRPELSRIDENGDHHFFASGTSRLDQTQVPLMQCPHRRNHPNPIAIDLLLACPPKHLLRAVQNVDGRHRIPGFNHWIDGQESHLRRPNFSLSILEKSQDESMSLHSNR